VLSEFGAGAIYGEHSPYLTKWSEEYQSLVLERSIEIFKRRGLGGFLVWQFADVRVSTEDALTRPRSFNNKGLLSERRERKSGFYAVKSGIKGYR
jgi:beta-glucuronidase